MMTMKFYYNLNTTGFLTNIMGNHAAYFYSLLSNWEVLIKIIPLIIITAKVGEDVCFLLSFMQKLWMGLDEIDR